MPDQRQSPTPYSEELAASICDRLSRGETLRAILAPEDMPTRESLSRWRQKYPEFGTAYDKARMDYADDAVDQCREIADSNVDPQKARNRIDVRLKEARFINPRTYSDKLQLDVHQTIDIGARLAEARAKMISLRDREGDTW